MNVKKRWRYGVDPLVNFCPRRTTQRPTAVYPTEQMKCQKLENWPHTLKNIAISTNVCLLTSYPEKYCNFYRRLLVRQFLLKWQRRLYAADYFSKKFKLELLIVQHAVRQLQLRRRWFVDFVDFVTCSQTTAIIKTAICSLLHMSWSLVAPFSPEWWRALCFEHNLTMGLILHEAVRQFIIHPFNHGVKLICPDINSRTIALSWHN